MSRRIVVMSNCQTGGLYASLAGMLPDDEILPIAWLGFEPEGLRDLLSTADAWVSSLPRAESQAILADMGSAGLGRSGTGRPDPVLYTVPVVWFPGFHPDVLHVADPAGGELESAVGPYNSAIVVWGWLNGLSVEQILERFSPQVFAELGYTGWFAGHVDRLRSSFDDTDLDFADWYLPLARRGPFMLTDNHPRLDALVQMARPVALALGADPALVASEWEQVIVDGLQSTSVVWPVYPGVAESLGLAGAYVWRRVDGELVGLRRFVEESMAHYRTVGASNVEVVRFEHDPRYDAALRPDRSGPTASSALAVGSNATSNGGH